MKIVFMGTGVIGGSVAGWIAPYYENIYVFDKNHEISEALKTTGITLYLGDEKDKSVTVRPKVIEDIGEIPDADFVVMGMKNYDMEDAAKEIKEKMGDNPVIVSMANGIDNQRVLPKYFSKIIYCVVSYNAWMDHPVTIGYQKKGPLVIGTLDNGLQTELKAISDIFNKGVETVVTPHIQDAIHCKIVINLVNSFSTLIGNKFKEISDPALFQKLLTGLTNEGMEIVKADGIKECKLGGMPSWTLLWVAAKLPRFITKPLFEKNVKKMVISSMAQDVIQRGGKRTELESINGYIIELADKVGHKAPFNRAIYQLCKQEFSKPEFNPIDVKEVWEAVQKII